MSRLDNGTFQTAKNEMDTGTEKWIRQGHITVFETVFLLINLLLTINSEIFM